MKCVFLDIFSILRGYEINCLLVGTPPLGPLPAAVISRQKTNIEVAAHKQVYGSYRKIKQSGGSP